MKKIEEHRHLLAEIISWMFYPPLVGTVFFVFLIFWYSTDLIQGFKWIVAISPFLIFIPLIFFAVSYKLGWISDIDLTDRKERPAFLLIFILSLAIASSILFILKVPTKFFVYVFSGFVITVVTSIITLYWKISFHTAVATSVATGIVIMGGNHFWPFFLIIPLIGWARVKLKKHTVWQVIGGTLVAFVITEAVYYFYGFNLFI